MAIVSNNLYNRFLQKASYLLALIQFKATHMPLFINQLITLITLVPLLLPLTSECLISNQPIGLCQPRSSLPLDSFCYNYISDHVCLPEDRPTWNSYDEKYKDSLVEEIFMTNLQEKLVEEYQNPWTSNIVSNNIDCYYGYRQFMCAWNFPACDPVTNQSKLLCKSVCVRFFENCQGNSQICEVVYEGKDLGLDPNC